MVFWVYSTILGCGRGSSSYRLIEGIAKSQEYSWVWADQCWGRSSSCCGCSQDVLLFSWRWEGNMSGARWGHRHHCKSSTTWSCCVCKVQEYVPGDILSCCEAEEEKCSQSQAHAHTILVPSLLPLELIWWGKTKFNHCRLTVWEPSRWGQSHHNLVFEPRQRLWVCVCLCGEESVFWSKHIPQCVKWMVYLKDRE